MFSVVKIALINLLLSTDNVLIIALFSKGLKKANKMFVLTLSLLVSIVLQLGILFVVAFLFRISFLKFLFGLLICYMAIKLLEKRDANKRQVKGNSPWYSVGKIVLGNLMMSFENEATLITLSNGDVWTAWIGIIVTSPFIFFGSHMITLLLERYRFILYIGSIILFKIGLGLVFTLSLLQPHAKPGDWILAVVYGVIVTIIYLMRTGVIHSHRSKA